MKHLDHLGILAGTDKSRLEQDYLRQYERLFQPFADQKIVVMEIGIHNGASLAVWERYFSQAQIVGVDIEPSRKQFTRKRVQVEIGSQFDAAFLAALSQQYAPSIIIDDGSHVDEHQIFTFEKLFPSLAPGGIYIVEDIQGYMATTVAADYFLQMMRTHLYRGVFDVASMEIIPRAVVIRKSAKKDELDQNYTELEKLTQQSTLPAESAFYLSKYMQRHGAPQERALALARRACALDAHNPWPCFEISKMLASQGDIDGAITAIRQAIALMPEPPALFRDHLSQLEGRRGG